MTCVELRADDTYYLERKKELKAAKPEDVLPAKETWKKTAGAARLEKIRNSKDPKKKKTAKGANQMVNPARPTTDTAVEAELIFPGDDDEAPIQSKTSAKKPVRKKKPKR